MLLWASRAIRRIRSGNDVPEVLAEKWSELCLPGKQTGKVILCGILGHRLETKKHRKAEMV